MNPLDQARTVLQQALTTLTDLSDRYSEADRPPNAHRGRTLAETYLWAMGRRNAIFGNWMRDGAWAILLDLYLNEGLKDISVSSACIASMGAPTTALRWIGVLTERGLVTRHESSDDARMVYLRLTREARAGIEKWSMAASAN